MPSTSIPIKLGEPVIFDYEELLKASSADSSSEQLYAKMKAAFGPESLGLCVVRGVPKLSEMRSRLLMMASEFAHQPEAVKKDVTHPASSYSFGWSHGKEIMNGKPDFAKGSYYNNPMVNMPQKCRLEGYSEKYPYYGFPNLWPTDGALPNLEPAFMELGQLIVNVGMKLATHIDAYISATHPDIKPNFISNAIKESETCKARLLHYFPLEVGDELIQLVKTKDHHNLQEDIDSWCGLHIDHSMLTGLTSAIYVDESCTPFQPLTSSSANPIFSSTQFQQAGLYVKDREGKCYYQVKIPADCLAFQIGEAAQVASRGLVVATPHLVRGIAAPGIARNTFAVFMQPNVDHMLTPELSFHQFSEQVFARHYTDNDGVGV